MAWKLTGRSRFHVLIQLLFFIINIATGLAPRMPITALDSNVHRRSVSPTVVCTRWSQQSALVNGTIYLYGGRATSEPHQTSNTWNNDFLTLDLTKTWQISGPSLKGLPKPSGPPKVSNGYLWASYDSFFLYGGEFSDDPITEPSALSLWEYQIASQNWIEYENPVTSQGENAPSDGESVLRAAEGAGFSVAALGKGWYFGGHEDQYTIPGWTYKNGRVYLTSLLEYTIPGYSNSQVDILSGGSVADSTGVFRNVTDGAVAEEAGFPERADGVLVWVPGFGAEGILIGLAGGTNDSFTQTNIIDVYDIATSSWYKQATSGPMPRPRVNPCVVIAGAADGSSSNVYLFGGQDLQPAGKQTQFNDMWILSIPTFTWIPVHSKRESVPPGRSGHTCNVWDGQMVVVGGYVGETLSCDSPGVYIFDLSSLKWVNQFTARSDPKKNPQSKQNTQIDDPLALQGSYSYQVPAAVQAVVGGGPYGEATKIEPAATATSGPLHTGKPKRYPLPPGVDNSPTHGTSASGKDGGDSTNVAAIAAGTVAGVLFLVLLYLVFVTILYRKRLAQYRHAVQRANTLQEDKDAAIVAASTPKRTPRRTPRRSPRERMSFSNDNGQGNEMPDTGIAHSKSVASMKDHEPSFIGIMMSPRRSLRVTNPD